MSCKSVKFRCDSSITKGTLLEEQSTFAVVSSLILKWIFLKFHTYHSLLKHCNFYKTGCIRTISKSSSLEEVSIFAAVSRLLHKQIFLTIHTYHSLLKIYNWYKIGHNRSISQGTLPVGYSIFAAKIALCSSKAAAFAQEIQCNVTITSYVKRWLLASKTPYEIKYGGYVHWHLASVGWHVNLITFHVWRRRQSATWTRYSHMGLFTSREFMFTFHRWRL